MNADLLKDLRFERCPRCRAVVRIRPGDEFVICGKCGVRIKIKR